MRFKTDENLPEEFAEILRTAGWDALSVVEQQLGGMVDPKIARICVAERRVLITLDLGFSDIRSYPPNEHAGIIVLRPGQQDKPSVLAIANRLIMALHDHPIDNELWIVDDRRIRIRS
jgi:predicted nuclease of predicted toxin-antitoxin system